MARIITVMARITAAAVVGFLTSSPVALVGIRREKRDCSRMAVRDLVVCVDATSSISEVPGGLRVHTPSAEIQHLMRRLAREAETAERIAAQIPRGEERRRHHRVPWVLRAALLFEVLLVGALYVVGLLTLRDAALPASATLAALVAALALMTVPRDGSAFAERWRHRMHDHYGRPALAAALADGPRDADSACRWRLKRTSWQLRPGLLASPVFPLALPQMDRTRMKEKD